MQIKQVMTPFVIAIRPEATLQEAAEKMREFAIGVLLACSAGHQVGMLTDRDIVVRAIARGRDPWTTQVGEVMTPYVVSCSADQGVQVAVRRMKVHQVRRLVVLD